MIANLLADLPDARAGEVLTDLLSRPGIRVERIVSHGQTTPKDSPMMQSWDEWVLLLEGAARLEIEGQGEVALSPGNHLLIEAGQRHWVSWTAPDRPTVWLALHFG